MARLCVWNMEWMNDLFDADSGTFKSDTDEVRGPHPDARRSPTVGERRASLSGVLTEIDPDVVVVVEGPHRATELQHFFDTDVPGQWCCDIQPTRGSSQIVGLAARVDRAVLADPPFERFHVGAGQGREAEALSLATEPFLLDTDDDDLKEQHRFERLPLYAEIRLADGKAFRLVGLHLKSKGIFSSLEWAKWWARSDANRKKIVARCRQLRREFLDPYLREAATRTMPLIVCGDINDGPGMDASERRLNTSGVERLMGDVWRPHLALGNALFDTLPEDRRQAIDLDAIYTTSFRDPLFGNYRRVWIDHVLYSRRPEGPWVHDARVRTVFGQNAQGEGRQDVGKVPACVRSLPDRRRDRSLSAVGQRRAHARGVYPAGSTRPAHAVVGRGDRSARAIPSTMSRLRRVSLVVCRTRRV